MVAVGLFAPLELLVLQVSANVHPVKPSAELFVLTPPRAALTVGLATTSVAAEPPAKVDNANVPPDKLCAAEPVSIPQPTRRTVEAVAKYAPQGKPAKAVRVSRLAAPQ